MIEATNVNGNKEKRVAAMVTGREVLCMLHDKLFQLKQHLSCSPKYMCTHTIKDKSINIFIWYNLVYNRHVINYCFFPNVHPSLLDPFINNSLDDVIYKYLHASFKFFDRPLRSLK